MADPWTQVAVHAALHNYDLLVEHAQEVALVVYRVRYPRDPAVSFEFFFDPQVGRVHAGYYYRSNHHDLDFPLDYLWETDADVIRQREQDRIAAERDAAEKRRQMQEAAEKAEQEEIERKTYERLKKKFEKGS